MFHWLLVHLSQETGTSNSASRAYDFWSGFGSDLGEVTLLAGVAALYRKSNCHSKGCWRLAHHDYEVNGVTYKLCRICHPGVNARHRRNYFKIHHERHFHEQPKH